MKIAITGHSRGLGLELFSNLQQLGHECHGYSTLNGYDVSKQDARGQICHDLLINNFDVFINNAAPSGYTQTEFFKDVFPHWRNDPTKTIVNIVSFTKYDGIKHEPWLQAKKQLSLVANPLSLRDRKCRIINVCPGYMDTPTGEELTANLDPQPNRMTIAEAADVVTWAVTQPAHIEIGELGFWAIDKD